MQIVDAKVTVHVPYDPQSDLLKLEKFGRVCYKTEDKISENTCDKFVKGLISRKHFSILEHVSLSASFTCNRADSLEIVRHRLASFTQASTRYCDYTKDKFNSQISVINPKNYISEDDEKVKVDVPLFLLDSNSNISTQEMSSFDVWFSSCIMSEWAYRTLIEKFNKKPEEARCVLPNCLMTELHVTANLREWRHIFDLRALGNSGRPHPDVKELMTSALIQAYKIYPPVFEDQYNQLEIHE